MGLRCDGAAMMRHSLKNILAAGILLTLAACGTQYRDRTQPIEAQADVDVSRYLGTWYEIARFPVPFQRGCVATTARYGQLEQGGISVVNSCRQDGLDGPLRQIEGRADVVGPGKLEVHFTRIPFVKAPYWILWIDDAYTTAVVGVPNGRAGWILARTPTLSAPLRARAETVLRQNGYDTSALIEVPQ